MRKTETTSHYESLYDQHISMQIIGMGCTSLHTLIAITWNILYIRLFSLEMSRAIILTYVPK